MGLFWGFSNQVDHVVVQQLMLKVNRPVQHQSNYVLVILFVSMMRHKNKKKHKINTTEKGVVRKVKEVGSKMDQKEE